VLRVCVVGVVVSLLATGAPAQPAVCRSITGTVSTQLDSSDCPSPVGICYAGFLSTQSFLRGETFFVVESLDLSPDGPTRYTGTLFVTLPSGQEIELSSTGELDPATGEFVEQDVADERWLAVSLTLTGSALPGLTGFSGQVSGDLCGVPRPRN
jgi:hypothetical protein